MRICVFKPVKAWLAGLILLTLALSGGCGRIGTHPAMQRQSSTPEPNLLTTEKAQDAIDRFVSANGTGGRLRIRGGVREVPSENAATADLAVEDFQSGNKIYRDNVWDGTAVFEKFSDGKWTLTQINLKNPSAYATQWWKPVIEVR